MISKKILSIKNRREHERKLDAQIDEMKNRLLEKTKDIEPGELSYCVLGFYLQGSEEHREMFTDALKVCAEHDILQKLKMSEDNKHNPSYFQ